MREPIPRVDRDPEPSDPVQWKKWREKRGHAYVERVVREKGWPRTIEPPIEEMMIREDVAEFV